MTSRLSFATAVLLAVSACGGGDDGPAKPTAPTTSATPSTVESGPMYGAPKVGECRNLTAKDIDSDANASPTVPCTERHTARVIAIGTIKPSMLSASDDEQVLAAQRICDPVWDKAMGGSAKDRGLTTYTWLWFLPTKAQQAKGARWIRCDVALEGGRSLKDLQPLQGEPPYLKGGPAPNEQFCQGGAFEGVFIAPCSEPGLREPIRTKEIEPGTPGDRTKAMARAFCSGGGYWADSWQPDIDDGEGFLVCYGY